MLKFIDLVDRQGFGFEDEVDKGKQELTVNYKVKFFAEVNNKELVYSMAPFN